MEHRAGESNDGTLRVDFDRRLKLEFHGSRITSDAGLLAFRELDDALGLTDLAGAALSECRRGKNTRHLLTGLFRQSVFGRLAGYEDVNDADRPAHDPAMRAVVDRQGLDRAAASTSQMGRFETEWLTGEANLAALTDLSGAWIVEVEGYKYTIRLPANSVLQERIGWLLKRPAGRPPHEVRRYCASFRYQAGSWNKPRRVVAKVEWHPGELYPRVGFVVTNMTRPAERVVMFYNHRGTAEQHIKEGKNAVTWTRLSCHSFKANAVRQQLHALAYNLANFLRTLTLPEAVKQWSLTTLRDRLVKIGAKILCHGRSVVSRWRRWRCRALCSGTFCVRSPRSVHRHRPDVEDHRLGWPARPLVGDARPNPGLWIGSPAICAIAPPQQRGRRAVTDKIIVKRLVRGLRSVTKVRNQRLSGES